MPTHWTYEAFNDADDLIQGDILAPTEELRTILSGVHPHFLDHKYTHFLVTTQSCDMARRKGICLTKYLNIAVVRQLEDVLHDFLSHVCKPVADRVYLQESKGNARRLLQRIFNQNEQALGVFYLHEDVDAGVAVPSVALLRVGIALRVQHYESLLKARCGRLGKEFTAKLGWLVGNLYSRVGTPDWSDPPERGKQLDKLIRETLKPDNPKLAPIWVKESVVYEAIKHGMVFDGLKPKELELALGKYKRPAVKERVISRAAQIIKEVAPEITDDQIQALKNRLKNDQLLANILKSERLE
jgi:hypothetical protein